MRQRKTASLLILVTLLLLNPLVGVSQGLQFELKLGKGVQSEPYSGRVYIMVNPDTSTEPRLNIGWVNPAPFFSMDVENVQPGESIILDDSSLHFPISVSEIKAGEYAVQAVARRSNRYPNPGRSPGDLYSKPLVVKLTSRSDKTVQLKLTEVVKKKEFKETDRIKLVSFESEALSEFHGRPYNVYASVALPIDWSENSEKKYPVVYFISGFGGSHYNMNRVLKMVGSLADHAIIVLPDARNYRGHSVFANSENTGPWGTLFVDELIPLIQKRYRGMGAKDRYVTGISSGGWSSLWLQVNYPERFSGVWAIVPDPVDFRDFQNINLYQEGANMYVDENGDARPLARAKGEVIIWYEDFIKMEEVMGPGGQIHSFEAVFSPRGEDGEPMPLFSRKTGDINAEVVEAWKKYDINLVLQKSWEQLEPKLDGKLRIYAGSEDTFYLEGAVVLLKETLEELGSNAEVQIVEGLTHAVPEGTFEEMFQTIYKQANRAKVLD